MQNEFNEYAEIVSIKIGDKDVTDCFVQIGKMLNPKEIKKEYNRITDILPTK